MRKWFLLTILACVTLGLPAAQAASDTLHYVGLGIRYWQTVDNIKLTDVDEEGFSWIITYQMKPARLLKIEADIEVMPSDYAGSNDDIYAPQGYVLLGTGIYVGVGAGFYLSDGKIEEDPFLALRAGLNAELLPSLFIDFSANYRFDEWDDLNESDEDIDSDTITIGIAARLEF